MPKALQRGEAGTRCRRRCGRDRRHSGGFLLRAMPPSWHPVPACVSYGILQAKPFSLAAAKNRIGRGTRCRNGCCRRAILHCSSEDAASIPKSGLEIMNRCTQEVVFGEILASIPKFELEIKNRCTQEGLNGEILASIRKSGLEIKKDRKSVV